MSSKSDLISFDALLKSINMYDSYSFWAILDDCGFAHTSCTFYEKSRFSVVFFFPMLDLFVNFTFEYSVCHN